MNLTQAQADDLVQKELRAEIAQEIWNHIDLEEDTHDIAHAINLGLLYALEIVEGQNVDGYKLPLVLR